MSDVKKWKKYPCHNCSYGSCTKGPSFGFKNGKRVRCGEHKEDGMISLVKRRVCSHFECSIKNPSFGFEGGVAERCSEHKLEGMVSLSRGKCTFGGCGIYATFGFCGKTAERCKKHKIDGMIPVGNKRHECTHPECHGTRANYGFYGEKAKFCAKHRLEGMVDVNNKMCTHPECGHVIASYGYEGMRAERCHKHALDGMKDVVSKRCPGPPNGDGCPINATSKSSHGFCSSCDPDEERKRKRKKTEERCFEELEKKYGLIPTFREFRVDYACITDSSKKHCRVDGVFDYPSARIFLEIDELAHSGYDRCCEERRMNDVVATIRLSGDDRPVFWIRFNPDEPGGEKRGSARDQRKRCSLVADSIKHVLKNPLNGVEYVNYYS